MTDPTTGGGPDPEARCPWCSTVLAAGVTTCPSCGAAVTGGPEEGPEAAIPGVTSIDPITAARKPIQKPNRLVSWLAGDLDPLPGPDPGLPLQAATPGAVAPLAGAGPESYAPPSAEVRREMARLELEAIKAELEASGPEAEPPATAMANSATTETATAEESEPAAGPEPPADASPRSPDDGGARA